MDALLDVIGKLESPALLALIIVVYLQHRIITRSVDKAQDIVRKNTEALTKLATLLEVLVHGRKRGGG